MTFDNTHPILSHKIETKETTMYKRTIRILDGGEVETVFQDWNTNEVIRVETYDDLKAYLASDPNGAGAL